MSGGRIEAYMEGWAGPRRSLEPDYESGEKALFVLGNC